MNVRKDTNYIRKKSGLNVTSKQRTKHPQDCPQSKLQLEYANKKI